MTRQPVQIDLASPSRARRIHTLTLAMALASVALAGCGAEVAMAGAAAAGGKAAEVKQFRATQDLAREAARQLSTTRPVDPDEPSQAVSDAAAADAALAAER